MAYTGQGGSLLDGFMKGFDFMERQADRKSDREDRDLQRERNKIVQGQQDLRFQQSQTEHTYLLGERDREAEGNAFYAGFRDEKGALRPPESFSDEEIKGFWNSARKDPDYSDYFNKKAGDPVSDASFETREDGTLRTNVQRPDGVAGPMTADRSSDPSDPEIVFDRQKVLKQLRSVYGNTTAGKQYYADLAVQTKADLTVRMVKAKDEAAAAGKPWTPEQFKEAQDQTTALEAQIDEAAALASKNAEERNFDANDPTLGVTPRAEPPAGPSLDQPLAPAPAPAPAPPAGPIDQASSTAARFLSGEPLTHGYANVLAAAGFPDHARTARGADDRLRAAATTATDAVGSRFEQSKLGQTLKAIPENLRKSKLTPEQVAEEAAAPPKSKEVAEPSDNRPATTRAETEVVKAQPAPSIEQMQARVDYINAEVKNARKGAKKTTEFHEALDDALRGGAITAKEYTEWRSTKRFTAEQMKIHNTKGGLIHTIQHDDGNVTVRPLTGEAAGGRGPKPKPSAYKSQQDLIKSSMQFDKKDSGDERILDQLIATPFYSDPTFGTSGTTIAAAAKILRSFNSESESLAKRWFIIPDADPAYATTANAVINMVSMGATSIEDMDDISGRLRAVFPEVTTPDQVDQFFTNLTEEAVRRGMSPKDAFERVIAAQSSKTN
jgi:hypothetical protein